MEGRSFGNQKLRTDLEGERHDKGLCCRSGCFNRHREKRWDCETCHSNGVGGKKPYTRLYSWFKARALKRGKIFSIPKGYYILLWAEMQARRLEEPGETHSVDRNDPTRGYVVGNCKVVTSVENSRKRWRDHHKGADCPF